jgi:superfamily II DNA/RNA helicase
MVGGEQTEREQALAQFKSGAAPVMVATEVAARGLDILNVGLVVVYDFPPELLQYVHRIGRTGRAGATGRAVAFVAPSDRRHAPGLLQLLKDAGAAVPPGTWPREGDELPTTRTRAVAAAEGSGSRRTTRYVERERERERETRDELPTTRTRAARVN